LCNLVVVSLSRNVSLNTTSVVAHRSGVGDDLYARFFELTNNSRSLAP